MGHQVVPYSVSRICWRRLLHLFSSSFSKSKHILQPYFVKYSCPAASIGVILGRERAVVQSNWTTRSVRPYACTYIYRISLDTDMNTYMNTLCTYTVYYLRTLHRLYQIYTYIPTCIYIHGIYDYHIFVYTYMQQHSIVDSIILLLTLLGP